MFELDWMGNLVVTQTLPSCVHKPAELSPITLNVIWQSWQALERLRPIHWKKSAICISCHQAWSSFRPDDRNIGSHSDTTQCTQRATIQDAQIKTYRPRVCSSSACWWGSRRPLLLLYRHCVPFQSPPATLVSFITRSDGFAANSRVPPLQEQGLSPSKGQWCGPKASSPRSSCQTIPNMRNCTVYFFTLEIWVYRLKRRCSVWVLKT